MNFIDSITDWFTDPSRGLTKKVAVAIIILFGLWLLNDLLGFAHYYRATRKVENFEKLTKIISDTTIDSTSRVKAMCLREDVVVRSPYCFALLSFLEKTLRSAVRKRTIARTTTTTNTEAKVSMRREFLFFVSSSGIYVIMGFIIIIHTLFIKRQAIVQKVAASILLSLLVFFFTVAMYFLTNLIPILFNDWAYNYILNAILQSGTIVAWIALGSRL